MSDPDFSLEDVARYWDDNAAAWAREVRQGHDVTATSAAPAAAPARAPWTPPARSGLGPAKDVQEHDGRHTREGVDEGRDQAQGRDETAKDVQQVEEETDDQDDRHQDRAEEGQRRRAPHRHALG